MDIDNTFSCEQVVGILDVMFMPSEIVLIEPNSAENDLTSIIEVSVENAIELLFECEDDSRITIIDKEFYFRKMYSTWYLIDDEE